MFLTVYANPQGEVLEHPGMVMLGRSGMDWVVPEKEEMILLPKGASLVSIPAYLPVGLEGGEHVNCLEREPGNGSSPVVAVAALLPQGFTRTLLPACVSPGKDEVLPLLGYAAVGLLNDELWVAAVQSDEHRKWHPRYYNTAGLPGRINGLLKKYPDNRILRQLARCSLQYSCYTAQNLFYGRWEAGIPTMAACNADCIGCISESHLDIDSPQNRLDFNPSVQEIYELALEHLIHAREGIISFGQGCEGEPSLNADKLSRAIRKVRAQTERGTINMNSNAGYTEGIKKMCAAGLDSLRVTLFSCQEKNYDIYHRPQNYSLQDVLDSISFAHDYGVQVSLNLLTFPGFTDREDEIEALLELLIRKQVDMVQFRNLNIDPRELLARVPAGGEALGIKNFIDILQSEIPGLKIGSYSHPVR
ncbi:Elongator protein 3/MiaB/NifB [Syntrophomonas zehnderi OL-4]|uniref:Elongator protein 3/MiaB/NifB n=1 Tax=Syntrophomonas zehnderi OL-4 TaxID=690567 RepID=A0A0E4C7K4_9FIRM|nr:radical SAM protein [Syntrophomonas zehnderi]CFX02499.1 Elongator protein 3/MiaB/NifB [Syntrophomonas zehnderi OL-4]